MWILLAVGSAFCLGVYDIMKKMSVRGNNVLIVLLLNTIFGTILMLPAITPGITEGNFGFGNDLIGHLRIFIKAGIVLSSWILGYFAIKHLPLTIQGPINASRPVMVLVGAVLIFGETLNLIQWIGIIIGFVSLFLISRAGAGDGFSLRSSKWIWMSIGAAAFGAVSGLYDKYLLALYKPLDVQGWYSLYQCLLMTLTIFILRKTSPNAAGVSTKFVWRWSIPLISLFLTIADLAYFYSLSLDGSMISVVSMIRRGSVIVPFIFGATVLREGNLKAKTADLVLLIVSLCLLITGSGK
ncbi:MAG: DMT family transporter [Paramuribaculum sp.]|nr:DMT family transporter [Paramuribaculum sp.]